MVEPPGAPPLPEEPPRASREVLEALPPPSTPEAQAAKESTLVVDFAEAHRNEKLPADMRAWVAKQLGEIDDPRSTEALLLAVADAEPEVVAASLRALAGRDDERIRAAAERARESGNVEIERAAQELLASVE